MIQKENGLKFSTRSLLFVFIRLIPFGIHQVGSGNLLINFFALSRIHHLDKFGRDSPPKFTCFDDRFAQYDRSGSHDSSFADNGGMYIRDDLKLTLGTDMQAVNEEKAVYDPLFEDLDPQDIYPALFMKYSADDTNTLAMNQANINNITDQTWSAWVSDSSRDIDAEWDAYVESVMSAGLSQNLEIRQAAFETYLANQG